MNICCYSLVCFNSGEVIQCKSVGGYIFKEANMQQPYGREGLDTELMKKGHNFIFIQDYLARSGKPSCTTGSVKIGLSFRRRHWM